MEKSYINKIIFSLLSVALFASTGCDKYLDVAPNKSSAVEVKTTADLDGLLNDYQGTFSEEFTSAIMATDDFGLTTTLWDKLAGSGYNTTDALYAVWERSGTLTLSDRGWSAEYEKIFVANLVLNSLGKATGSDEEKERLSAEAHFVRAYSYWVLANTYCLPFTTTNANEPGLPLKLTVSFDESKQRVPLSKVYEQIELDLTEAMKVSTPLVQNGKQRNWRANTAAIHTFAARYYLDRNNYEKALTEATAALDAYNELTNYNTDISLFVSFPLLINSGSTDPNYPQTTFPVNIYNNFIAVPTQYNEITYYRYRYSSRGIVPPSQELLNLYDKSNDLRYTYNFIHGFTYYFFGLINYPAFSWPTYNAIGSAQLQSGPSVPEAILIRAEAQARLGNFHEAMTTVNTLRAKRIKASADPSVINLSANSKEEAIEKILLERRREMPFTMRWYDMRRLNNNEYSADDVIPAKTMYDIDISGVKNPSTIRTIVLDKNSRKYAFPIPNNDIIASQGAIQQNTY